jgi:hypothetical protein
LSRINTCNTPINIDNVTVARMFYPLRVYSPKNRNRNLISPAPPPVGFAPFCTILHHFPDYFAKLTQPPPISSCEMLATQFRKRFEAELDPQKFLTHNF